MFGKRFQLNEETLPVVKEIGRHMPGGFFIYKASGDEELLYANQSVLNIYGCETLDEFKALTGFTFKGMVHPQDYMAISKSIDEQIDDAGDKLDYVEYRIIRRDGAVRWVDDYGHYTETDAYGGIFYVFISDISEKRERMETDMAVRNAVIEALSESYHTVWLINDVETESFSLYRGDVAGETEHAAPIRDALKRMKYSQAKEFYIKTTVAESDRERLDKELTLDVIVKQLHERPQYTVNYLRKIDDGSERYFRIEFAKVNMPGGKMGVVCGFKDVDADVRQGQAIQRALREAEKAKEERDRRIAEAQARARQEELEKQIKLQQQLLEQEKHRQELDSMITAMASDYRSVYHVDLDADNAVCYRADPQDPGQTPEGVHFPFHKRFMEYCERHVDEKYKKEFSSFIDPDNIRKALATENIIACRYLARRDGREYYEMLRMAGVRHPSDRDDHIVHAVGVGFTVIDAEMRRSIEQNLTLQEALAVAEEANRAKTAFLSNMSHEIRTPMNAIIGLNNIALDNPRLPDETRVQLEKIGASAQHLLSIINDILDMSRIESGRMTVNPEEFSFKLLLEQINAIIGSQCREKGITYECNIGNTADSYIGDDMKLRQVMINILGNAVKFTPAGGKVSFNVEELARLDGKATLRFTISDTGIGMSKEFLPRLFDTFSQEDLSASNEYGSTGLGMPITKSLVELMNGRIDVESEKGEGTTFTVTLTLKESNAKAGKDQSANEVSAASACGSPNAGKAQDEAASPAGDGADVLEGREKEQRLKGKRILLAEDIMVNAEIMMMVLGMKEMEVEHAENGQAAVDNYKAHEPGYYDAVLMDMRMPVMDGLTAARAIRSSGRADAKKIPIIALTANAFDEDVQRSMQAGLNAHLSKPVEPDILFKTLEELIAKAQDL